MMRNDPEKTKKNCSITCRIIAMCTYSQCSSPPNPDKTLDQFGINKYVIKEKNRVVTWSSPRTGNKIIGKKKNGFSFFTIKQHSNLSKIANSKRHASPSVVTNGATIRSAYLILIQLTAC